VSEGNLGNENYQAICKKHRERQMSVLEENANLDQSVSSLFEYEEIGLARAEIQVVIK